MLWWIYMGKFHGKSILTGWHKIRSLDFRAIPVSLRLQLALQQLHHPKLVHQPLQEKRINCLVCYAHHCFQIGAYHLITIWSQIGPTMQNEVLWRYCWKIKDTVELNSLLKKKKSTNIILQLFTHWLNNGNLLDLETMQEESLSYTVGFCSMKVYLHINLKEYLQIQWKS